MNKPTPNTDAQEKGRGRVLPSVGPQEVSHENYTRKQAVGNAEYPQVTFTVGVATDGSPQSKRHYVGPDGAIVTEHPKIASHGTVTVVECPLNALPEHFKDPSTFMILGVPRGAEVGKAYPHTTKGRGEGIARTGDNYEWPDPALVLIDVDLKEANIVPSMQPWLEQEQKFIAKNALELVERALKAVGANLKGVARLARRSASSGIRDANGAIVKDGKGVHFFLPVTGKTPGELLEFLHKRLVIDGRGYCYVTKSGRLDIRTVIDKAVGQANRIAFEAPPTTDGGLTRSEGKSPCTPGGILDLTGVDLAVDEEAYQEACRALKAQPEVKALVAARKAAYQAHRQAEGRSRGMTDEQIDALVGRTFGDRERIDLFPKDGMIFRFDDGREAAIAEVLADPDAFQGCSLADPFDEEQRPCKAKFFWNKGDDYGTAEQFIINLIRTGQTVFLHGEDIEESGPRERQIASRDPETAAEINRLAQMPELDFEQIIAGEAKKLGTTVGPLRKAVKGERMRLAEEERRKVMEGRDRDETAWVQEFNEKFSVVRYGNKMAVGLQAFDPDLGSDAWTFVSFKTFEEMHSSDYAVVGYNANGQAIAQPKGAEWLKHPKRARNRDLYFDPGQPPSLEREGYLNLWTGFAVQGSGRGGDPEPMLRHIREVICKDDPVKIEYVMGWLALLIQEPGTRHEVALVLRGEKGTGKGTLGNLLRQIFGRHGIHLSQARHLTGNFNKHLHGAAFVFADEAFFAGDKSNDGPLKALITEPTAMIEPKGVDGFQAANRISVLMATNAEWVARMGADERRYAVMDVSGHKARDTDYFGALAAWMKDDRNVAAFVQFLRQYDLESFNVRRVPETTALAEQRAHSLPVMWRWWADCLTCGSLSGREGDDWHEVAGKGLLHDSFCAYLDHMRASPYERMSANAFGRVWGDAKLSRDVRPNPTRDNPIPTRLTGGWGSVIAMTTDGRPHCRALGPLDAARAAFVEAFKLPADFFDQCG